MQMRIACTSPCLASSIALRVIDSAPARRVPGKFAKLRELILRVLRMGIIPEEFEAGGEVE